MINCVSACVASGWWKAGSQRVVASPPPPHPARFDMMVGLSCWPGSARPYGRPSFVQVTLLSVVVAPTVVDHVGCVAPEELSAVTAVTCSTLLFGSRIRAPTLYFFFAHGVVVFWSKYSGKRGSFLATMRSTRRLPILR